MRASWYSQALYEILESHKGDESKLLVQFKDTVVRNDLLTDHRERDV